MCFQIDLFNIHKTLVYLEKIDMATSFVVSTLLFFKLKFSCHDIAEILLKLALNTNQSII